MDFEIFDVVGSTSKEHRVYDSDGHISRLMSGADRTLGRKLSVTQVLSLPGRDFTLRVNSTPAFDATHRSWIPEILFVVILLVTVLLGRLVWQQGNAKLNAETIARRMTTDLERLAQVVRNTSNAVIITDIAGNITWVNEGFERITGYSSADVLGISPGKLLQSEETDTHTVACLREALHARREFRCELINRNKQGRTPFHYFDKRNAIKSRLNGSARVVVNECPPSSYRVSFAPGMVCASAFEK